MPKKKRYHQVIEKDEAFTMEKQRRLQELLDRIKTIEKTVVAQEKQVSRIKHILRKKKK